MSRSARRSATAVLALALLPLAPARAESPSPSPEPSARSVELQPRVVTLHPRVVELHATVVDLAGAARVSTSSRQIDVRLDADILFAKDSATIRPAARARLAQVAAQLKAAGRGRLQVVGYTDDLGSAAHGITLSTQRAVAVQQALAASTAAMQVSVVGRGAADPLVPNRDERSRAQNRRVELHFTRA